MNDDNTANDEEFVSTEQAHDQSASAHIITIADVAAEVSEGDVVLGNEIFNTVLDEFTGGDDNG